VCWHIKTRFESGPVTADLTTTVVHSNKSLINDVKTIHSLTLQVTIDLNILFIDCFFLTNKNKNKTRDRNIVK